MNEVAHRKLSPELVTLALLVITLIAVAVMIIRNISGAELRIQHEPWLIPSTVRIASAVEPEDLQRAVAMLNQPIQSQTEGRSMFVSELRVAGIGSAYPIPYDAEVCPFTKIRQPAMNQLDRDGDGITDDWELKYGLNKYNVADAKGDLDGDGFTNIEEFQAGTEPDLAANHPPYATKLRFVERKWVPFPLVFQGVTRLSDGTTVFQLNTPANGMTHFASLNEEVEGVVLQRFIEIGKDGKSRLFVMRGSSEIELVRGEISADPESKAELINILDRDPIIVTMGALLSLRNDEYTVLGVYADRVVMRHLGTGEVFDIINLAEGE